MTRQSMTQNPGPEAPRTPAQLYLVITADRPPEDLTAVLEAGDVACMLLLATGLDQSTLHKAIARLRPPAQERGVAFLLQDQAALAAETGCDGVHLSDPKGYKQARRLLGEDATIGVGCGASRHAAMEAAEVGADYIAFGAPEPEPASADPELLAWWQAVMTPPCVAFGAASPEDCAALAAAGADFVALESAVWSHPEGAPAGLSACARALAEQAESA